MNEEIEIYGTYVDCRRFEELIKSNDKSSYNEALKVLRENPNLAVHMKPKEILGYYLVLHTNLGKKSADEFMKLSLEGITEFSKTSRFMGVAA